MPDAGNPGMGPPPTPPDRVEYEINELVKKQVEIDDYFRAIHRTVSRAVKDA